MKYRIKEYTYKFGSVYMPQSKCLWFLPWCDMLIVSFTTLQDARDWIYAEQLSRNDTPFIRFHPH
jgi:hypothetical protein